MADGSTNKLARPAPASPSVVARDTCRVPCSGPWPCSAGCTPAGSRSAGRPRSGQVRFASAHGGSGSGLTTSCSHAPRSRFSFKKKRENPGRPPLPAPVSFPVSAFSPTPLPRPRELFPRAETGAAACRAYYATSRLVHWLQFHSVHLGGAVCHT